MANLVNNQFQVCAKLFNLILTFGKRYLNDSYSITLYLNMGRLINAECELNELLDSSEKLLVLCNFLRIQTVCKVVYCAFLWKKKWLVRKAQIAKARKL